MVVNHWVKSHCDRRCFRRLSITQEKCCQVSKHESQSLLMAVQQRIRARRVPCGIVAFEEEDIQRRVDEGFRMIGLGFDTTLIIQAMSQALAAAGRPVPRVPGGSQGWGNCSPAWLPRRVG